MTSNGSFAAQFAAKAERVVEPGAPSTTHWRGIEDLIAERLGVDRGEVYATTISKAGNVTVRFFQSRRAVRGKYLAAMCTGDLDEIETIIDQVREIAIERGGIAVIAASEADWEVLAVTGPERDPLAAALISEFPRAILVSF